MRKLTSFVIFAFVTLAAFSQDNNVQDNNVKLSIDLEGTNILDSSKAVLLIHHITRVGSNGTRELESDRVNDSLDSYSAAAVNNAKSAINEILS